MKWPEVLTEAIQISRLAQPPVVLVTHAGGNDICSVRVPELLTLMRVDIDRLLSYFQEAVLVWSEMIP